MAFVTTHIGEVQGPHDAYNIDFSVGIAQVNLPADVQLVQALFRIAHYELQNPFPKPPGHDGIEVTGQLDQATLDHIFNWQQFTKSNSSAKVLIDGIFDPFRAQGQSSTIAKVRYTLELLNNGCNNRCFQENADFYKELPRREDIPSELHTLLNSGRRTTAIKYMK